MVYLAALQNRLCSSAVWLAGVILASTPVALALDGGPVLADAAKAEPATAPIEVKIRERLLAVDARDAPLADVLRIIGEKAGFTVIIRGHLSTPVTSSFAGVPLDKAIGRLVGKNSWIMIYGPSDADGRASGPLELHVYGSRGTGTATVMQSTAITSNLAVPESSPASLKESILEDLARPERDARTRAIGMLGRLKDENSIDLLIQVLLEEEVPSLRRHAVITLGRIWSDRAIEALAEISLSDPDDAVREAANSALEAVSITYLEPDGQTTARSLQSFELGNGQRIAAKLGTSLPRGWSEAAVERLTPHAAKPVKRVPPPSSTTAEAGTGSESQTTAVTPSAPSAPKTATVSGGRYLVQLSSLSAPSSARKEWTRLQKAFPDLFGERELVLEKRVIAGRGTFYRVQTGRYEALKEVRAVCDTLKAKKQDCLVIER